MFTEMVTAIRHILASGDDVFTTTVRHDETPPSAVFHATIDGYEYVISITPTRAVTVDSPESECVNP